MRVRGRFGCLFAIMCGISGVGMVIAISSIKAYMLEQELESEHVLQEGDVNKTRGGNESWIDG